MEKNFAYYLNNKQKLVDDPKYYGKYIVIKGQQIVGVYDTENEAIFSSIEKGLVLGEFMVQVVKINDGSVVNFATNVYV